MLYLWRLVRSHPDVMFGGKEGLAAMLHGVAAAAVLRARRGRGK